MRNQQKIKAETATLFYVFFAPFIVLTFFAAAATAAGEGNNEAAEKARNQLLKTVFTEGANALPVLIESLDDERTAVRRTAAHLVRYLGNSARAAFRPGLKVEDEHVSRVVLDAVAQAGVLDQYIEPVVTHQADSVRRYFYHRLLPEQLLTDGQNKAQDLVKVFNKIYYSDVSEKKRNEMLRYFYLDELPGHILVDGKPSEEYMGILKELYSNTAAKGRRMIVDTVSDLPVTDASTRLLNKVRNEGKQRIAETAHRTILESKLKRFAALEKSGKYQKVIDEFAAEFGDADFDTWPEELAYKAFFVRSEAYRKRNEPETAAKDLKRAVSYQAVAIAYRNLGYIYRDQLDEPESAIRAFKNAAERDWASHVNHSSVLSAAAILRDLGRPKEALDILSEEIPKEINDMGNNWGPRYVRAFANTLQDLGDYEAAIGYYRRMLEADFGKKHNEQAEKAIKKLQQKK